MAVRHISLVGSHSLWWSLSKIKVPQYFWKPQNNFTETDVNAWKIRIQEGGGVNTSNRRNNCFFEQGICVCVCKENVLFGGYITLEALQWFQEAMRALSLGDSRTRIYLLSITTSKRVLKHEGWVKARGESELRAYDQGPSIKMHLEVEMGREGKKHEEDICTTLWKMEAATGVHSPGHQTQQRGIQERRER